LSYGVIAVFLLLASPLDSRVLPFLFVILWSVRLVSHIIVRLRKHGEDSRYATFRISWGDDFLWKTYLYIFLLQGLFISIIALPLFIMMGEITAQFVIGALLWIV
jgi:steroid 5-alpha reductase family enzyme